MLNRAELMAFVATTDLERSLAFYSGALNLPIIESQTDAHTGVVDANGTRLRLTLVDEVAEAGYTVIGWEVDDIELTAQAMSSRGVAFNDYPDIDQDNLGIWTAATGDKVAWFADPDGNILSITQFVRPD